VIVALLFAWLFARIPSWAPSLMRVTFLARRHGSRALGESVLDTAQIVPSMHWYLIALQGPRISPRMEVYAPDLRRFITIGRLLELARAVNALEFIFPRKPAQRASPHRRRLMLKMPASQASSILTGGFSARSLNNGASDTSRHCALRARAFWALQSDLAAQRTVSRTYLTACLDITRNALSIGRVEFG